MPNITLFSPYSPWPSGGDYRCHALPDREWVTAIDFSLGVSVLAYAMEQVALLGPDTKAELDLVVLGDAPAAAEEADDEEAEEELDPRDERGAWESLAALEDELKERLVAAMATGVKEGQPLYCQAANGDLEKAWRWTSAFGKAPFATIEDHQAWVVLWFTMAWTTPAACAGEEFVDDDALETAGETGEAKFAEVEPEKLQVYVGMSINMPRRWKEHGNRKVKGVNRRVRAFRALHSLRFAAAAPLAGMPGRGINFLEHTLISLFGATSPTHGLNINILDRFGGEAVLTPQQVKGLLTLFDLTAAEGPMRLPSGCGGMGGNALPNPRLLDVGGVYGGALPVQPNTTESDFSIKMLAGVLQYTHDVYDAIKTAKEHDRLPIAWLPGPKRRHAPPGILIPFSQAEEAMGAVLDAMARWPTAAWRKERSKWHLRIPDAKVCLDTDGAGDVIVCPPAWVSDPFNCKQRTATKSYLDARPSGTDQAAVLERRQLLRKYRHGPKGFWGANSRLEVGDLHPRVQAALDAFRAGEPRPGTRKTANAGAALRARRTREVEATAAPPKAKTSRATSGGCGKTGHNVRTCPAAGSATKSTYRRRPRSPSPDSRQQRLWLAWARTCA